MQISATSRRISVLLTPRARYKAKFIDGSGNGYLKTACDYVHLNPARANMLNPEQPLAEFPWSSFPLFR